MRPSSLFLLFFFSTSLSAESTDSIAIGDIANALQSVSKEQGHNFCQSDTPCRDGMQMTLSQINSHFVREPATKVIPSLRVIVLLKTEELYAKANCGKHYAGRIRRQRCCNGAQAAVSFVATELGINRAIPPLQPSVIEGQASAGYEKYNECLRTCATHSPPPSEGCEAHCKDAFDLKAFLDSLPQLR